MTQTLTLQNSKAQGVVDSLRSELLSGHEERARIAAAFIRSAYDIRDQYRRAGMGLVVMIDGVVQDVHPDSPLLPDLTSLVPFVKQLFPLPPEEEPPGFE
ncbi:MAG: hypothetical protein FGM32_10510 [Candidatus Kapabacteria bacterium]|nr:hypothetical protein [Candidatus Kapabacteria bacterium]